VQAICIAVILLYAVENSNGIVGRVLNSAPLRFIGVGSYSIYLWQQLFVSGYRPMMPMGLLYTALAAVVSYLLIERPSFALRARLERRIWNGRDIPAIEPTSVSQTEITDYSLIASSNQELGSS
jgi:peptidoglycan/LPS O-acetylase OafA/YrhL